MSVHLRHAHVILREGGDVLLVLLKAVRNVLFPVALLACHLALVENGLGVIFLIEQPRACHQESEQSEAEDHDACLLVLQRFDLDDLEGGQDTDGNRRKGDDHSDDGKCTHATALHQLLVAVRDNLFLQNLLKPVSGNRCHRYGQLRLLRGNLLCCGTDAGCRFALAVLLGKFGLRFGLLHRLLRNLRLGLRCGASEEVFKLRRGLPGNFLRGLTGEFLCKLGRRGRCRYGTGGFLCLSGKYIACLLHGLCDLSRRIKCSRLNRLDSLDSLGDLFGNLLGLLRLRLPIGRTNRCRIIRLRRIVKRFVEKFTLMVSQSSLRKKLCQCLLLRRSLILDRSGILNNLDAVLRGYRSRSCGHLGFGERCLRTGGLEFVEKIHLLLECRLRLSELSYFAIPLFDRLCGLWKNLQSCSLRRFRNESIDF